MLRYALPSAGSLATWLLSMAWLVAPAAAGKPNPPPTPPVRYTLTLIDSISNSSVRALNELGVAVGDSGGRAVMWLDSAESVDLTELAYAVNPDWVLLDFAYEINEANQIVGRGWRLESGELKARLFRYSPQRVDPLTQQVIEPATIEAVRIGETDLTLYVEGLNDFGDVLIHATSKTPTIPSLPSTDDSAWIFSGPAGSGTPQLLLHSAVPKAINNSGQVTGAVKTGTESCAFRWTPGASIELFKTISGAPSSQSQVSDGMDINDLGVIAGWALQGRTKTREDSSMRIVRLRNDGKWEDLLGTGANNWAKAINTSGDTVGNASGANMVGSLYTAGKLYALRDLLVNPLPNLKYINPEDINDTGEICGKVTLINSDGTTLSTGMILTPVP